jgi:hypothetical protein
MTRHICLRWCKLQFKSWELSLWISMPCNFPRDGVCAVSLVQLPCVQCQFKLHPIQFHSIPSHPFQFWSCGVNPCLWAQIREALNTSPTELYLLGEKAMLQQLLVQWCSVVDAYAWTLGSRNPPCLDWFYRKCFSAEKVATRSSLPSAHCDRLF